MKLSFFFAFSKFVYASMLERIMFRRYDINGKIEDKSTEDETANLSDELSKFTINLENISSLNIHGESLLIIFYREIYSGLFVHLSKILDLLEKAYDNMYDEELIYGKINFSKKIDRIIKSTEKPIDDIRDVIQKFSKILANFATFIPDSQGLAEFSALITINDDSHVISLVRLQLGFFKLLKKLNIIKRMKSIPFLRRSDGIQLISEILEALEVMSEEINDRGFSHIQNYLPNFR